MVGALCVEHMIWNRLVAHVGQAAFDSLELGRRPAKPEQSRPSFQRWHLLWLIARILQIQVAHDFPPWLHNRSKRNQNKMNVTGGCRRGYECSQNTRYYEL